MSFAYGIPVRELQKRITSREFTELWAYKKRKTLSPDVWESNAVVASTMTGVPADFFVPGRVDSEKVKKFEEDRAERAFKRQQARQQHGRHR